MAGRNFLFVPGPTNVPDRINRSMIISMEDHRSPIFPRLYESILPGLKKLFRTTTGTPFIFPSSGSGCWGPKMRLGSKNELVQVLISEKNKSA